MSENDNAIVDEGTQAPEGQLGTEQRVDAPRPAPHLIIPVKRPVEGRAPKRWPLAVAVVLVVAALLLTALVLNGGVSLGGSGVGANSNMVTKSPQEMLLTLADFPSGWQNGGPTQGINSTGDAPDISITGNASARFNTTGQGEMSTPAGVVELSITTFDSVESARSAYDIIYRNITSQMSISTNVTGHFEKCLLIDFNLGSWADSKNYIFQEKNTVGIMQFGSYLNYDMPPSWIDDILTTQEGKIV